MADKSPAKKPAPAKTADNLSAEKPATVAKSKAAPKKAAPKKTAAKKPVAAKSAAKKPATAPKAKPAPKEKIKKPKLIRDSFTMPEDEYQALVDIKKACIKAGFEIKKSELLRIGVKLLGKADPAQLKDLKAALPALKAGRPKKDK